ncbi:unnamed protein product, partial [Brugia timori]
MREIGNEGPLRNESNGTAYFWKYPVKRNIRFEDDAFKDCTDRL